MNLKQNFTFLVCVTLLLGCNEGPKKNAQEPETKNEVIEKKPNKLVFEADIKTTQPDNFSLSANNVFLNNSQFINIKIEQKLNANETQKKLRFEFPENIKPDYQLYFNLGTKAEKEIVLDNILLSYGNTRFEIASENVMEYFTTNRFVSYNEENNTLVVKKIDNKLNPLLMVRKKILDSIQNVN